MKEAAENWCIENYKIIADINANDIEHGIETALIAFKAGAEWQKQSNTTDVGDGDWKEKFISFATNDGRHRYIDKSVANSIIDWFDKNVLKHKSIDVGEQEDESVTPQQITDEDIRNMADKEFPASTINNVVKYQGYITGAKAIRSLLK